MNDRSHAARSRLVVGCALVALPSVATAQLEGIVGVEARAFAAAADSFGRAERTLVAQLGHRLAVGAVKLVLGASARLDPANHARNQLDVTDLVVRTSAGRLALTLGVAEVTWGVLERRNLVDVVNQRDPELRWPSRQKLGQPTAALSLSAGWLAVEVALLPWGRSRPFRGRRGRLWLATAVDATERRSGVSTSHVAWATRWSFALGAWELDVSYFDGSARDPRFEIAPSGGRLLPVYDRIRQVGAEAQYTGATWLWKIEAVSLNPGGDRHVTLGSGVEYAPADYVSVFAEGFFDSRGGDATTSLEHDVFLGTRLHYQDGSVTGGAAVDVVTGNMIGSIEIVRRLRHDLVLGVDVRGFAGRAADEPPFALREETAAALFLRRYF